MAHATVGDLFSPARRQDLPSERREQMSVTILVLPYLLVTCIVAISQLLRQMRRRPLHGFWALVAQTFPLRRREIVSLLVGQLIVFSISLTGPTSPIIFLAL